MVIVLVLLLGILSTQTSAHVGDRAFYIPYVSADQLTVDGDLADWKDLFGEPIVTRLDFELSWHYGPPHGEYDPANLEFRAWMAWSDHGRVYVAIEASDDVYRNTDNVYDHVALMVDGDHSGGRFVFFGDDGPDPRNNSHAQYYDVIPYSNRGLVRLPFVAASDWVVDSPYAFGAASVQDGETALWTVEFYVTAFDRMIQSDPGGSEISTFEPGRVMGFILGVFDWDHDDRGSGQFYLHDIPEDPGPGDEVDVFVDGILVGPDSAIESTTWARIKATVGP